VEVHVRARSCRRVCVRRLRPIRETVYASSTHASSERFFTSSLWLAPAGQAFLLSNLGALAARWRRSDVRLGPRRLPSRTRW
jgi:hypothetical protein